MAENSDWEEIPSPEADSGDWEDITSAPSVSKTDSALRGAVQGATMGFRDELAGAVESPIGALKELANKFGTDFSDEELEAYRRERDESRKLDEVAKAANPKSYMAGEIGGGVATAFVPGLGGAATLGKLAAQGALTGAGSSDSESLGGLATDTAVGGALGAGMGYAAQKATPYIQKGLDKVSSKISDKLGRFAEDQAIDATGATYAELKAAGLSDEAKRSALGRSLLDASDAEGKVLTPFSSKSKMAERMRGIGEEAMNERDIVYSAAEAGGAEVFPYDIASKVDDIVNNKGIDLTSPLNKDYANLVDDINGMLTRYGPYDSVSPEVANSLVHDIQRQANYTTPKPSDVNKLARELGMGARETMNDQIGVTAGTNWKENIQGLNKKFSDSSTLDKLLSNAAGKESNKSMLGLSDYVAAGAGSIGGVPGALGTLAVKKAVGKYGNQVTAVGADRLSSILANNPQRLGKYGQILANAAARGGNQAVAANHFILQQTDSNYRKVLEDIDGESDESKQ